jgi:hypothetical protein
MALGFRERYLGQNSKKIQFKISVTFVNHHASSFYDDFFCDYRSVLKHLLFECDHALFS